MLPQELNSFQKTAALSPLVEPPVRSAELAATTMTVIRVSPFTGMVKVMKSFTPSKESAGRPLRALATTVGRLVELVWVALRPLPDWSAHCDTPDPASVTPTSLFSHSESPFVPKVPAL